MALFCAQGKELFDAFDRNHDGKVTFKEFIVWLQGFNYKNKALKQIVVGDESQRKFNVRGEMEQLMSRIAKAFP